MIVIALDDADLRGRIAGMLAALGDGGPAMAEIAEYLAESTRRRFLTETDPEGRAWAPRSPATLAAYAARNPPERPGRILTLHGQLSRTIAPFSGPAEAGVGSAAIYAAAMQFGMRKGDAGTDSRGRPIPWGDIPARPFLGLSAADRDAIGEIVAEWLARAAAGGGAQSA